MRSFFKYLVFFFTVGVLAQTGNVALQWEERRVSVGENTDFVVPVPDNYAYVFRTDFGLVESNLLIEEQRKIDEKSFKIVNIKTQRLAKAYKDIDVKSISSELQYTLHSGKTEKGFTNVLSLVPFIKKGNDIHKIISFDYEYKIGSLQKIQNYSLNASSSVLANGAWYKIKIGDTGIYKLDKNFLTQLGIPSSVDPRTIKVYGHGGAMMPLKNSENIHFDNPEVSMYAQGENDGVLNDGDYFLFYGVGTKKWDSFNVSHNNLYSDDSYYYITYGGNVGKRTTQLDQPSGVPAYKITDSEERVFHERDLVNVANLSRKWFGETFSTSFTNNYTLNLINLVPTKPALFTGNMAVESPSQSFMEVSLNGVSIGNYQFSANGSSYKANERYFQYTISQPQSTNQIAINFNNNGVPSAKGYVDYVAIDYYKSLLGYNKQFGFRNKEIQNTSGIGEIVINNASAIAQIWDVSDPLSPSVYQHNGNQQLSIKVQGGQKKEYVALDTNDIYVPISVGQIANQDLKGTIFNNGAVDYLIITTPELVSAANRLAQFHTNYNNYNVKVITLPTIYEEFSSGKQDIVAIRNFVRYVYHNSPDANRKLRFLNLFGDASFDYKNRIANNTNIVPIFQSLNNYQNPNNQIKTNFNDQTSFSTDDFYALMDEEEGLITEQNYLGIDIAVGRMIASNIQEANTLVDKVITYHEQENSGRWKLNGVALADDVDSINDRTLQTALNKMVDDLVEARPIFNVKKILMDSYQQEVSAAGPRYPKAKQEFYQAIESGALFVNFLGHGNEKELTGERMMDATDIEAMNNATRMPLFIIVTCEFTRFDNPSILSGGEKLILKSNGGAISLLATSRKIGISNAELFTKRISEKLFESSTSFQENISIAEALRLTKNTGLSEKAVVNYLGDPAIRLSIPKPEVVLTKVNGIEAQSFTESLKALDFVKIEGKVQTEDGVLLSDFNGDVAIQIYDKNTQRSTLGNDNVYFNGELYKIDFETLGETIFKGNAKVQNGIFSIEFVVPKDIRLPIGEGKISFYASKNGQGVDDYAGANTTIKIGGINNNAPKDDKAPEIKLYMNDESFVYGGTTNASPLFLAILEDENGINTASGIGHSMIAILDGNENNPIVVNEFFETEPNNFRKGIVKYPFKNLSAGIHNIVFKAWDSYNNMGTAEIQFVVSEDNSIQLKNVLNYPNPFIDYTEFWFEHNKPAEPLQVQVQILTVTGKIVKTINQVVVNQGNHSRDLHWDGRDDFGNKIGKGVYIYKLKVKSTLTGQQTEKIEKLVIL